MTGKQGREGRMEMTGKRGREGRMKDDRKEE
jgi:hypothetical protein